MLVILMLKCLSSPCFDLAVRNADEFIDLYGASRSLNQTKFESGGTLIFHENLDGHAIRKHVGQTSNQLLDRLSRETDLPGATTFSDINTAQKVIGEVLTRNRVGIQDWLQNSPSLRHNMKEVFDYNVGHGIRSRSINVEEFNKVWMQLIRDDLSHSGYRIVTAFPDVRNWS